MREKYFTRLSTIFLIFMILPSCSVYRSSSGLIDIKGLKEVQIQDSGRLYSTYDIDKYEREELLGQLSEEALELVEKYHREDSWPEAISNFEKREKVRSMIKNYRAFILAEMGDKYILIIPARANRRMPLGFRPKHDVFFIISRTAVGEL